MQITCLASSNRSVLWMCFLALAFASAGHAEEKLNAVNGIAMDGFDVVAYFKQSRPVKGKEQFSTEYKDKKWLFSSEANAKLFEQSPTSYEPQFNGWCSYAVSEGYGAEVDFVDGWALIDDKLYLNWDRGTRDVFVRQQNRRKKSAHENWQDVHAGLINGTIELYTHQQEGVSISHPQNP